MLGYSSRDRDTKQHCGSLPFLPAHNHVRSRVAALEADADERVVPPSLVRPLVLDHLSPAA